MFSCIFDLIESKGPEVAVVVPWEGVESTMVLREGILGEFRILVLLVSVKQIWLL